MIDENTLKPTPPSQTSAMEQREHPDEHAPVLRVWLMDGGRIAWRVPPCYEQEPWSSRRTARAIFFLLLCAPNRQALRGQLIGILWPETPEENAQSNLRSALKVLRQVLRQPPADDPLMEATQNREALQLKGQEIIWTDVDALELLVQQANQEPDPQRAFLLWQQARALLKGEVLAEDRLHEWVNHRWIRVKRHRMQALRRHVIRSLADVFVQRGEQGQAVTLLQEHIISFPTDQDALYRLLKLLMQAECFEEARATYERGKAALQSLGKSVTESVKGLAEHLMTLPQTLLPAVSLTPHRTDDLSEQERRQSSPEMRRLSERTQREHPSSDARSSSPLVTPQQREMSSDVADTVLQRIMGAIHQLEGENTQIMNPVRRATITGLLNLMSGATASLEWWERLASPHSTALNANTFLYFQQLLETGWGLSNVGELQSAEHILMGFLPKMLQLAPHRQEAALLAAEGLRLHGILLAHQQRLLDKLTVCLQAVEYARQANNITILIAQLTELAVAFKYACQPMNSFHTYQEAVSYCVHKDISPLVRSRIYAASAATYAKYGYLKEASSFIDQAYDTFPTQFEQEPCAFSADNKIFMIDYYQGLLHLVTQRPKEAFKTFEQALVQSSQNQMPERWRLIILNYQGLASILSNQFEHYAWCLEEGLSGALALGSKKRFDEAVCIFQRDMPQAWHAEPRMKQITERFQLERESRREEELEI